MRSRRASTSTVAQHEAQVFLQCQSLLYIVHLYLVYRPVFVISAESRLVDRNSASVNIRGAKPGLWWVRIQRSSGLSTCDHHLQSLETTNACI